MHSAPNNRRVHSHLNCYFVTTGSPALLNQKVRDTLLKFRSENKVTKGNTSNRKKYLPNNDGNTKEAC